MNTIVINHEKCIRCEQCINACVAKHLYLENGEVRVVDGKCIECGHCYAVCPTQAVAMMGYDYSGCDTMGSFAQFDEDEMLLAMKSRRSVRKFKTQPVTEEQVRKIIEAGRYAPTATNM